MQPHFIDYSPVPDSPFPESPHSPFLINASMRSDSYRSPRPSHRRRQRHQPRLRWQQQWGDTIEEDEVKQGVKGKWGSRFCRNQSCKRQFHPRPPPPPPPPTASIVVRGGTKKTLKKRHKKRRN